MVDRRKFIQASLATATALGLPWPGIMRRAFADTLGPGLSNPALQPKFVELVPNALDPGFFYVPGARSLRVGIGATAQQTGLVDAAGNRLWTAMFGYGQVYGNAAKDYYTWPGRTFQVQSGQRLTVKWENNLAGMPFPITGKDNSSLFGGDPAYDFTGRPVVDRSTHWAYSLMGYETYTIANNGIPVVPHVHGGHSDFASDGNPEYFFGPDFGVLGPRWVSKEYFYDNSQPAGTVWYHDHALGITRLNVYAGMAGFYIIRDKDDSGDDKNRLSLPFFPYEAALAIQDRMFKANGELFYPAFPGDPFYADFIDGEGAVLPRAIFPGGGPTALAEFFGDHMVVNGKIWPKMDVEPRNYRLRFLNGCDSRFLVVRFRRAATASSTDLTGAGDPLPFTVIGSDQGLTGSPKIVDTLVMETGSRYDVIFDFKSVPAGSRIIMENIGGDTPFGFTYGDGLEPEDLFPNRQTDRIMAFDVNLPLGALPDVSPTSAALAAYSVDRQKRFANYQLANINRTRRVALFEGKDELGRLQPLLGTAEPATDYLGQPINWPATPAYANAGLVGQMEGSIAWHSPTTENPNLGDTELWEIYNVTGDSHPIHLHLVHFEVIERRVILWDSNADEDGFIPAGASPAGDGTYLVPQPVVQHTGVLGEGFRIVNATYDTTTTANPGSEYADGDTPKDMVTARPGEVTFIKAQFDKPGHYVWHCHILSHEDHEMMRALHVGPGA